MGRKCCVPGCKSNYDTEKSYTPVFSFPREESRCALWLRNINRADFNPTLTTAICVNHFSEKFIIREDRVTRDDGSLLVVPRKKLALTADAYPTVFPSQHSYWAKEFPSKRRSSKRFREMVVHDEESSAQWCSDENSDVVLEFSEESFSGDCDGEDEDDGDDSSVQRVIKWVSNREHLLQADIEKKQFELQHELAEHDQLQVVGAELRKLDKIIKDKRKCLKRLRDKSEITEAEQKKKCFLGIEFLHLQNKVPGDYEIPDTYGVKIEKI